MSSLSDAECFGLNWHSRVLENGLTVLSLPDPNARVFSFQTWINVGSSQDPAHRSGMAHLFEHLMFKGTTRFPEGEFDRRIESLGGRSNAATWLDWTQFYVDGPQGTLAEVMELEHDRLAHLVLDQARLTLERSVVLNERGEQVDDDPDEVLTEVLWQRLFGDHPYGRPTIGFVEDIEAITLDDCVAFYREKYRPENMALVAVGGFDEDELQELVSRHYADFGGGDGGDGVLSSSTRPSSAAAELRLPIVGEKLFIGFQGPSAMDPDNAALTILNEALFVGESSRAEKRLIEEDESAAALYGFVSSLAQGGIIELSVDCRPGRRAEEALDAIREILSAVRRNGLTEPELRKAKNRVETRLYQGLRTAQGRAQALGYWWAVAGDAEHFNRRTQQLAEVTLKDIDRAVDRWLGEASDTVVVGRGLDGHTP